MPSLGRRDAVSLGEVECMLCIGLEGILQVGQSTLETGSMNQEVLQIHNASRETETYAKTLSISRLKVDGALLRLNFITLNCHNAWSFMNIVLGHASVVNYICQ